MKEYSLVSTVSTMVACSCGGILFSKYSEHNGGMFLWTLQKITSRQRSTALENRQTLAKLGDVWEAVQLLAAGKSRSPHW